jgi:carbamoyltransferase
VVVIDAIGEIDTISIFRAEFDSQDQAHYTRLWRKSYPHSLGIFYSALTERVGLEPMEEEYITMGMSTYGNGRILYPSLRDRFVANIDQITFTDNLHVGMDPEWAAGHRWEDMAAAGQQLTEQLIMAVMRRAKKLTGYNNVVFTGGVALNCVANRLLGRVFKHAWIIPNPGDAGSSLGAAALVNGRRLHWRDVYLGTLIPGPYPVDAAVRQLVDSGIVGVASGRAEFGPRALGHRSLLADPRGPEIKDRVNDIKRRQRFRPFAPAILEELAHEYFVFPRGWNNSRYMQSTAQCRHRDLFPAICHVDGSSRVQTVPADGSGFRQLLEKWYEVTGCPMLLNTSLNVRGEPMVNTRQDADRFQDMYNVMVVS